MSDVTLSVTVSRDLLGLGPLELSESEVYYCAPQFLGATVQWAREQVTSPFTDTTVTTYRHRQQVTEQIAIEVRGASNGATQAAVDELIAAFCQDSFVMDVYPDDAHYAYTFEAADYQLSWSGPRLVAHQAQVVFSAPRQPYSQLSGAVA